MNLNDPNLVANEMMLEINEISQQLFGLWNMYTNIMQANSKKYISETMQDYYTKLNDRWGESIFREIIETTDFTSMPPILNSNDGSFHESG